MDSLFTNAVASIQLGIEDYQANDPKRSISAVRNFYAGALLLAKEVLAREAPDTNPEQILGTSYRPIPDGQGGVQYKVTSHRTIDFVEMGRRFQDFDIPVDRRALNDLNRIRNAIEHSYTNASHDTVREAIAKAFPVVIGLFRHIKEDPRTTLGDECWQRMLDARFVYERELQECRESFGSVDWRSAHLDETKIICPECGSSLMVQACPENTSIENIQATCRQCGEGIEAEKLIEAALEKHFEFDSYIAATDGGEQPLYDCPECTIKAYVISEDENACVWCGLSLEKCWRCHTTLTPNNVSPDSNNLCDYCNHIMSKDD